MRNVNEACGRVNMPYNFLSYSVYRAADELLFQLFKKYYFQLVGFIKIFITLSSTNEE